MERNIKLEEQAIKDYKELQKILKENNDLKLEQMCEKLKGHNLDLNKNLFDVNFKSICATVYYDENNNYELNPYIEIWDDENCCEYDLNFDIRKVVE